MQGHVDATEPLRAALRAVLAMLNSIMLFGVVFLIWKAAVLQPGPDKLISLIMTVCFTSIVHGRARTPECSRCHPGAHWANGADGIEMINQRHPDVAGEILTALSGSESPSIRAVLECGAILREADFEMPTWAELADGARIQRMNQQIQPTGGQRDATLKLETKFFQEQFWPILSELEQAQMRSQSGPMSSEPFTSFPTSREARFNSQPFRVLLLRRLRPPPSSQRPSLSV